MQKPEKSKNKYGGRREHMASIALHFDDVDFWGKKNRTGSVKQLTVGWLLEVDIGVAQGAARDDIAADANRQDGSDGRELFKKHRLGDVRMEIPDVEWSHCVAVNGENNTEID